ncbi:MAG TPA: histidinol-phosphatase [Verrucomicrobiales bacterium]|nr:histidinol-phosphatase [Verrucomicrobiales bacterium]
MPLLPRATLPTLLAICLLALPETQARGAAASPWWKGNLHTHTLWSDGDDFPEMVVDWYKNHGYQFLGLSDHNLLQVGEKWVTVTNLSYRDVTLDRYRDRFGAFWVTEREWNGRRQVRLKTLPEFGPLLEEKGKFLLIPATEITSNYKIWPVHVNASNVRAPFPVPQAGATSVREVMQQAVDMVLQQRAMTGQPMFPHINHPNFGWAVTAEDLTQVKGERFFEVYNGHPGCFSFGDGTRLSAEQIWDVALSLRLTTTHFGALFGLAVDDSHRYHEFNPGSSNPGRGWVMVRAPRLEPSDLILAMERGDFYATTGVRLRDVRRERKRLLVEVEPEEGVSYTIRFIGTHRNFNPASAPILSKDGSPYPTTRRYQPEVGMAFLEVSGTSGVYEMNGTELYVRATVISTKRKENPQAAGEHEMAWTQPLFGTP